MFKILSEYIKRDRNERRLHLKLNEECIEIGGDSRLYRGLLAHKLKTTINCRRAYVCHACHNSKCSNPNHLYWGTPLDNYQDNLENGKHENVYVRSSKKYNANDLHEIYKENGRKGGKIGGGSNRLSDEIINSRINDYNSELKNRGLYKRLSLKWNCSHTQVKRFIKKYVDVAQRQRQET